VEVDDLYGLPLEQFIPQRGARTRALRNEGEGDEAARVGKLRKPSVAAWAVNQLVRTRRKQVAELFDAGDAAQQAQADLLAGRGDAALLRDASRRERETVESLLEAARGLLSANGHELSPTTLERVADTLHAAALDPGAREQVEPGRLERELRHVGVAVGGAIGAASPVARAEPEKKASEAQRAARAAEASARRARERAERALDIAEERRRQAAEALATADAAAAHAREAARAAASEHKRLLKRLERK
jgi:hypothetical protein